MPLTFQYIFVFLFGAVIGSFLNVCIYRIPLKKSIVSPPSSCPSCGELIKSYDNVPIFGYIFLGGKCRNCKTSISIRYPLIEALCGLLALSLYYKFSFSADFFIFALFTASLVVITFIDLDKRIIPDVISLPGIVIGLCLSYFITQITVVDSLIGIISGGGSLFLFALGYHLLTGKEGMGGGDIKLLAMIGAFTGWKGILFTIFASSLIGSVIGVALMAIMKKDKRYAIPFGPFLSLGTLMYVFFGEEIINWYLNNIIMQ